MRFTPLLALLAILPLLARAPTAIAGSCGAPADIEFLFDTTGSMGGAISQAQAAAQDILNGIRADRPDAQFAVGDYRDYPFVNQSGGGNGTLGGNGTIGPGSGGGATYGGPGDYPWELDADVGSSDASVVGAIGALFASGGGDGPESLARALYESDNTLAWRAPDVRVIVLFTDAPPHADEYGTGGDPGRDSTLNTSDDIDYWNTLDALAANGTKIVAIDAGFEPGGYQEQALHDAANRTSGAYAMLSSSNLTAQVVALVGAELACPLGVDASGFGADVAFGAVGIQRAPRASLADSGNRTFLDETVGAAHVTGVAFDLAGAPSARGGDASATTTIAIADVPGLLHAEGISTHAEAHIAGDASSVDSRVSFAKLVIDGIEIDAKDTQVDRTIALPGATIVLNERAIGEGPANVTAAAIHVRLASGAEIVIGSAHAAVGAGVESARDDAPILRLP